MPIFDESLGHPEIQEKILHAYRSGRMPHAFLFYGPEGSGKDAMAIAVAQLLNAADEQGIIDRTSPQYRKIALLQHPDVQFIFPTPAKTNVKPEELQEALAEKARNPFRQTGFPGKNTFIGIDTIRELKKEASFKRYEGRQKVFIISEADQMRVEAANALLKLLEEPPPDLVIILITANIYKILPTIKSRCQLLRFRQLPEAAIREIVQRYEPRADARALPALIRLSGFNLRRTFAFLDQDALHLRDQAIDFLRKTVMIHKSQELLQLIEPVAAQKDRTNAHLLLWFLLLWFRDILHLQKGARPENEICNVDQIDTLKKFMTFTPNADVIRIVGAIEQALRDLTDVRNFNPLLIFTALAIKLHKQLKNK